MRILPDEDWARLAQVVYPEQQVKCEGRTCSGAVYVRGLLKTQRRNRDWHMMTHHNSDGKLQSTGWLCSRCLPARVRRQLANRTGIRIWPLRKVPGWRERYAEKME